MVRNANPRGWLLLLAVFGAAGALANTVDAARAHLLLKTLSYDRKLTTGSAPFVVGVVGPDSSRSQLISNLGRDVPPPIKDHPVVVVDCGEQGPCDEAKAAKAVLLLPGLNATSLQAVLAAAHRTGRYTLGLDPEHVTAGAMVGLTSDNRTLLNKEALSGGQVDFEPAFARRAQLVGKALAADTPIEMPERGTPPVELPGNARPQYPRAAQEQDLEGEVVVKVVVRSDGSVGALQLIEGDKVFAEPTLVVMRNWRWQPARLDGNPISVYRVIRVPFRLQ